MLAGWDASAMPGPHPLVLMRQGNLQHALNQAVLAETLASQGFVVATVPSAAYELPIQSDEDVPRNAQLEAEALLAAASYLRNLGIANRRALSTAPRLPRSRKSSAVHTLAWEPAAIRSAICIQASDKADWSLGGVTGEKARETERSRTGAAHAAVSTQLRKSSLTPSQISRYSNDLRPTSFLR